MHQRHIIVFMDEASEPLHLSRVHMTEPFALGQERRSEIKAIVSEARVVTWAYLPTARSAIICACQSEAILAPTRHCGMQGQICSVIDSGAALQMVNAARNWLFIRMLPQKEDGLRWQFNF